MGRDVRHGEGAVFNRQRRRSILAVYSQRRKQALHALRLYETAMHEVQEELAWDDCEVRTMIDDLGLKPAA